MSDLASILITDWVNNLNFCCFRTTGGFDFCSEPVNHPFPSINTSADLQYLAPQVHQLTTSLPVPRVHMSAFNLTLPRVQMSRNPSPLPTFYSAHACEHDEEQKFLSRSTNLVCNVTEIPTLRMQKRKRKKKERSHFLLLRSCVANTNGS